jgi:hypothetical protein
MLYIDLIKIVLATCHLKNYYICYHLPTRGRAGVKLGDANMLQTYLYFLMLHACFTPIALCFVYTSWYFYAFSGTNLLKRCHSVLGIGRNKSQSAYLSDTKMESKRETEKSQEAATP